MKKLTYLLYTLLALHFAGCKSDYKSKHEFRKERIEKRDSLKTLRSDTVVKHTEIKLDSLKAKEIN